MKKLLLLFLCLFARLSADDLCFFIPPKGWELLDPTMLQPSVKIAFFKKSSKDFCPSINLSVERTDVSLSEYLKAVRAIHEKNRNTQWRALGKVHTRAGLAQLTEIDSSSDFGPIRILQLILMRHGYAYILTAAALKEEFSEYYKPFQAAFRSMQLTNDLISAIPQLERRESLKEAQEKLSEKAEHKNAWEDFERHITGSFEDMGPHWQMLILKAMHEKLHQVASQKPEPSAELCRKKVEELLPCFSTLTKILIKS